MEGPNVVRRAQLLFHAASPRWGIEAALQVMPRQDEHLFQEKYKWTAQSGQAGVREAAMKQPSKQFGAPLVSVIIPCYNQGRFLSEGIESVLAQTYFSLEIIVVDDGSLDDTSEVAARYPSVRCIRQENQGLPGARNTGFRESQGKFLMFLDADDRLTANAVEAHLRCFADHPEAGFVVGDLDLIGEEGLYKDSPRWPLLTSNFYEELLRVNHVANTIAVMFRRSVLEEVGGFDRARLAAEDYEMLLRAARSFPSAHHRTVVAYYRRYITSMSRNGVLMLRSMHEVMHAQQEFVKGNSRLEAAWREGDVYWRGQFGAIACQEIISHLRQGGFGHAWKTFLGLFWYVRGRVLLLPWNNRRRIWRRIRARLSTSFRPRDRGRTVRGDFSKM